MKYIIKNGLATKHMVSSCIDSIMLTISSDKINGMETNIYFTKDKKLVIATSEQVKQISNSNTLENYTYNDILKYNFGSKVKANTLLTFNEVLDLFKNSSKILLVNILDHLLENNEFMRLFINTIYNYPTTNLYIRGSSVKILETVNRLPIKALVGIEVNKNCLDNIEKPFNFYCLDINIVNNKILLRVLDENKAVFIDNSNGVNEFNDIESTIMDKNNVYIITDKVN